MKYLDYINQLHTLLENLEVTDSQAQIDIDDAFVTWQSEAVSLRENKQTIYLVGNGASASMASHFAADLAKNGQFHSQTLTDLSLITAISNDLSYEDVFSEPLSRRAKAGDMLVTISSSGSSPNIVKAIKTAREFEMYIVTLSGINSDNPSRKAGDLNFYINDTDYGNVETCHAAILHHWMDKVSICG
ncbi:MAG: SIS domain-containing protein [Lentisphaeria bacterium]|nr:SIS domain-containing protein [Lentisphaeria bacterium]NQZ68085.1 SIS domain-containing protein [Lentisphaeria bacterium]